MGRLPERRTVRALAWRARWAIWALFAALLVRIALPGVVSAAGGGEPVVVLAHDLAAGSQLTAVDLRLTRLPAAALPDGALVSADQAVGNRLTIDLPGGMVLVESLLSSANVLDGLPAGKVAAAVRLNDPGMTAVLAAGDRIDVMASPGPSGSGSIAPAQRLAKSVQVLGVSGLGAAEDGGSDLFAGGASATESGLLLVAVSPEEAALIGGAASWALITAVLVPP
ncbi:MAG: SAF domain-containing protein [Bifidobacteriaceae bacterium]|nr:SAF domain-containing protein [Bifidobacteriaceae bacterium]